MPSPPLTALTLALLALLSSCDAPPQSAPRLDHTPAPAPPLDAAPGDKPPLIVWAWARHEDLRAINPRQVGVAFLAATITLRGDALYEVPRLQPLSVPDDAWLEAVVRLEPDPRTPPSLDADLRRRLVARLVRVHERHGVASLQLDYDAPVSHRAFYRALLVDLRAALPADVDLTMTALSSWCMFDDWLEDAPVDEVVPMLYDMGRDEAEILAYLAAHGALRVARCRATLGLMADAPPALRVVPTRRRYLFSKRAWTPEALAAWTPTRLEAP